MSTTTRTKVMVFKDSKAGVKRKVDEDLYDDDVVVFKDSKAGVKRKVDEDLYDDDKLARDVTRRAKELQANLAPQFPSIIKHMLKSHVTGCFCLGLPKKFCSSHMPKQNTTVILEDECGKEYKTIYLATKSGLSGGWRAFSIAHNLLVGDVIVFHLVDHSKLKVYIVRRNGLNKVDGALGLLQLDASIKQLEDHERDLVITTKVEDTCLEPLVHERNIERDNNLQLKYENESDDSEVVNGIRLAETVVEFKQVKSFDDFTILTNGLVINSELSKHLQAKYYELCCSQNSFLHDHILEGLNCRLVAGIIAETINIADAIRASKLTASRDYFKTWEKTLKAFDDMGMKVGFLRARLNKLVNLPLASKRIQEAKVERKRAEEEKQIVEEKLLDINERIVRLDSEIKTLETDGGSLELMFKETASAPW